VSDPDFDAALVRRAHDLAVAQLQHEASLATPIPTLADVRVALARAGWPMPAERVLRLCAASGLALSDYPAERDARRPLRG
jgi:hypothetical protein